MDFDIHRLDRMTPDSAGAESAFEEFQQELLERFAQSPEGQQRLEADPDMGFWAAQLMYYGYQYEGAVLPRMTVGDVQTVVTELFPRKISLESPEHADDAIPELVAFWKYLKREFTCRTPMPCWTFCMRWGRLPWHDERSIELRHGEVVLCDGQAAGFDMTTEEGLTAFMAAYNMGQLGRQSPPPLSLPPSRFSEPSHRVDSAARKADLKRRRRAAEARLRDRKRRK